jgi:predicted GIY-YIG superfamily endonuclease
MEKSMRITYVYRFFSEAGELLYVGVTRSPERRFRAHQKVQPWWHEVASCRLEICASAAIAYAREATAILEEGPKHNHAVPSLSRHDLLYDRAEADAAAALPLARRLELAEDAHRKLAQMAVHLEQMQRENARLAHELALEREAALTARADASRLAEAVRQLTATDHHGQMGRIIGPYG